MSEPYYSQRAQCLRLSEHFFFIVLVPIVPLIALFSRFGNKLNKHLLTYLLRTMTNGIFTVNLPFGYELEL